MRNLFFAALASLSLGLAVVPAYAGRTIAGDSGPVREGQGVTTALSSNVSALTYWVSESDGWHVVTTIDTVTGQNDEAEDHSVVRFSSVLLPGQSQLISVPLAIGEQQKALRIRRLDDQIKVEFVPVI